MMNRSVMDRQMFARGGQVRSMQAGGDPMMAPPAPQGGMGMPPAPAGDMGMPPAPSAAALPVPPDMSMEAAAAGAVQQGIDPAILEAMLQQAAGSFGSLDAAAETEDYEQIINTIRGDQAPLQERRQELANVVGDADAAQTPESVLTLVQPVLQIAAVDQGIGSMAPEAMNTPVSGDMAGGIMSTVNMAEEPPMPGQGGPAPVNFNQGGAVQYMQQGGVAMPNARQQELFEQQRALYGQLLDPAQQAADLEEQRNLTQAQMLFDIAQGGLLLATPGERNVSPVSRFAEAFTPVLGNIGARAGEFGKFKREQKAEERQLDLAALQGAQSLYSAERSAALAAQDKDIGDIYRVAVTEVGEDGQPVTRNLGQRPLTRSQYDALIKQYGAENVTVSAVPKASQTPQKAENFMLDGEVVTAIPGTPRYNAIVAAGGNAMGDVGKASETPQKAENFRLPDGSVLAAIPGTKPYEEIVNQGGIAMGDVGEEKFRFEKLEGADGSVSIVRINERTGETIDILDRNVTVAPSYGRVIMPGPDGRPTTRIVDTKTPEGQAVIEEVNRQNEIAPNSATFNPVAAEDVTPRGFYVPGTEDYEGGVYTSYDGGRTFTDMSGVQRVIPSNGFEVSNTIAYDVNRNARVTAGAQAQLDKMDAEFVGSLKDANGEPLSAETRANVTDALRQARLGTGFWSKIYAGIDGLAGGVISPKYFSEMFRDTQDGRQFVELVRVLGRAALAASPRFAVADLQSTEQLFPDERAFFRNPETEARKLSRLAERLQVEKRQILELRVSGKPIDSQLDSTLNQKMFAIERLESLLGPILTISREADVADMERAQSIMNRAAGQGNQ